MTEPSLDSWDRDAVRSRDGHVMQSAAWAVQRSSSGWNPATLRIGDPLPVAAVHWRRFPLGLEIAYVPRGPVFDHAQPGQFDRALGALADLARRRKPIFLKVDPEIPIERRDLIDLYAKHGFFRSPQDVQPALATFEVDLRPGEDEIIARFDKDTRWSVRTAEKRGVSIDERRDDDALRAVADLYMGTGRRADFITRERMYYVRLWRMLIDAGHATLFVASLGGEIGAGAVLLWCGDRAVYMYGTSSETARKTYAAYALQWHCMRAARARGCVRYDLGGVPVDPDESDLMHGLYLFKKGFGGTRRVFAGAYDLAPRRNLYRAWLALEPRLYAALAALRGRRAAPQIRTDREEEPS